ncbi:unnamed protein product [Dimorphilus gyrociliatus]|uniref:Hexosyltransferase n=1 Tax=Dimorphilus gyrociliatus TaxID=2664684 RepID=A0A7I8VEN1_9ANNE|nr:unnamed protein product [Dimorphilus gyrociliatus]
MSSETKQKAWATSISAIIAIIFNKRSKTPSLYGWIILLIFFLLFLTWRRSENRGKKDEASIEINPKFFPLRNVHQDQIPFLHLEEKINPRYGPANPKQFPVNLIHQPKMNCQKMAQFVIILVFSPPEHTGHRKAIRSSWGQALHFRQVKGLTKVNWKVIFVMGMSNNRFERDVAQESKSYSDILQAEFNDSPYEGTRKLMTAFNYLSDNLKEACSTKFILKLDDNIFLNMPSIIPWLYNKWGDKPKNLYVGKRLRKDRPIRLSSHPKYVSKEDFEPNIFPDMIEEPVFLLSTDTLLKLVLASKRVVPIRPDDAYLGLLAKEAKIKPIHNDHFQMIRNIEGACHHLKMFFIFNIFPSQHLSIFRKLKSVRQSKECQDAELVDRESINKIEGF